MGTIVIVVDVLKYGTHAVNAINEAAGLARENVTINGVNLIFLSFQSHSEGTLKKKCQYLSIENHLPKCLLPSQFLIQL